MTQIYVSFSRQTSHAKKNVVNKSMDTDTWYKQRTSGYSTIRKNEF